MSNTPIQYTLAKVNVGIGDKKRMAFVARPTGRRRISFRQFSTEVARATTFTPEEVQAVLNLAMQVARDHVAGGDIVEYGDLGTLVPSFRSKAVATEDEFRALTHITKPVVKLQPSRRYFALNPWEVSYERATAVEDDKKQKPQKPPTPSDTNPGGGGSTSPSGGVGF